MPALRRLPDTIFYHQKMLLTPFIDTNNNQCAEFCLSSSQATVDAVYPASFAKSGDAPQSETPVPVPASAGKPYWQIALLLPGRPAP